MPKAREVDDYPWKAYWALIERAARTREPITIPCRGVHPMSLRGEMYAFRRACLKNKVRAETLGINTETMQEVVISTTKDKTGLVLIHRDNTALAQAALEALRELGATEMPEPEGETELQASIRRLMEAQQEADAGEGENG